MPNLLIELWRLDFRQRLARMHSVSEVHQASLEVAIGAGEDGEPRLTEKDSCSLDDLTTTNELSDFRNPWPGQTVEP